MKKNGFAEILSGISRTTDRKVAAKLPSLAGIRIPSGLALEQCSSEAAALHKAVTAVKLASGKSGRAGDALRIADLTGGLGIDCWAFSRTFGKVLYNEMNPSLSEAVRENFETLGIGNVTFCGFEIRPDSDDWKNALASFGADIIYLDPARRDAAGRKVFLIEDCSPNVLELLPALLCLSPLILLKLSPMADISLVADRLSGRCREATGRNCLKRIQAAGLNGECKELLCIIDRDWDRPCSTGATKLDGNGEIISEFIISSDNRDKLPLRIAGEDELTEGRTLLCPDASILKAGLQDFICESPDISKLDRFTQLYLCKGEIPETAGSFFSAYRIIEVLPFCNRSFKDLGSRYPSTDVTARNLPISSEELKLRIFGKNAPAGTSNLHIWGFSTPHGRQLAVCERICNKQ